jgi:hypothetical protein
MGIRIPKVPQLVPVAKAMKQAETNIMAGRRFARAPAFAITDLTKSSLPRREVVFLRAVARVRMIIAGTIALKP